MKFIPYMHIERFGFDKVRGINLGTVYVFPKLDGCNGSSWVEKGDIKHGSRNNLLTESLVNCIKEKYDHAPNVKQYEYMTTVDEKIKRLLLDHPDLHIYYEFLYPHTVKDYREDAWNKPYVIDVYRHLDEDTLEIIPYDEYVPLLEKYDVDYIPAIAKISNPTLEKLNQLLESNKFLMKDGSGAGEGIIIKNYAFRNMNHELVFAKLVRNEFKEEFAKTFGYNEANCKKLLEEEIIEEYLGSHFIEKEFTKFLFKHGLSEWDPTFTRSMLDYIYDEWLDEEISQVIRDKKNPIIDFQTLRASAINKIKQVKNDCFKKK